MLHVSCCIQNAVQQLEHRDAFQVQSVREQFDVGKPLAHTLQINTLQTRPAAVTFRRILRLPVVLHGQPASAAGA